MQLTKERVEFIHKLLISGEEELAVKENQITREELDHFLKYSDEYGEDLIVYLSVHGKADPELVRETAMGLENLSCVVRMYEKGIPYDSYKVKNSDLIIVFPYFDRRTGEFILGRGTESEMEVGRSHGSTILACTEPGLFMEILGTEKTSIADGDKVDWLDTARITSLDPPTTIEKYLVEVYTSIFKNGRKIYVKENKITAV